MTGKFKTKNIIKSLKACSNGACRKCSLRKHGIDCIDKLMDLAADRLEELAIFEKARITVKQPVKSSDEFVRQARLVDHWRDVDD